MLSVTTKSGIYNGSKVIGTQTLGLRGLVLWLKFNEGSGNIAYDSSFYNNHGTIYGAVWTDGKYGKALYFDGVDDKVEVKNSPNLHCTEAITIAVWVYFYDVCTDQKILSHHPFSGWLLGVGDVDGKADVELWTEAGEHLRPRGDVSVNAWNFIVVTYDASKTTDAAKIYVNGELKGTEDGTGSPLKTPNENLYVGVAGWGSNYLWGIVDEVKIYNRVLSDYEIKLLYYNRIGAVPSKTI